MKIWDSASGTPEKVDTGETLLEKAHALHLADKFPEAEAIYGQLMEQNYKNGGLMATLGSLYIQQQKWGLGIHFLQSAIDVGLKEPDAYANLALGYQRSGQYEKARTFYEKSIEGDTTPTALTNYSGMFIEAGQPEKCIELCERALKEQDLPIAHWNLALALLGEGQWERAWKEHEWGLKPGCLREDRIVLDLPLWDGTPGKTVLVYGEQGLGDEIMFASMIPDLMKTNTVILECHKRLEGLFKASFPGVTVHGTREDSEIDWAYDQPIDYRIAIGSLGKFFRNSREAFPGTPYLKAEASQRGKFRVGISWKGGGAKLGRVQKRSVPLTWWKPILDAAAGADVEVVSLQYGTGKEEDLDMMDALGYAIARPEQADAKDYAEVATLVASCDLVITICTSIVHLAGALGVPCWCITPRFPAWRYQNSGGMPWYRSVRLYRSPSVEQAAWRPVIDLVAADLEALVGKQKLQRVA